MTIDWSVKIWGRARLTWSCLQYCSSANPQITNLANIANKNLSGPDCSWIFLFFFPGKFEICWKLEFWQIGKVRWSWEEGEGGIRWELSSWKGGKREIGGKHLTPASAASTDQTKPSNEGMVLDIDWNIHIRTHKKLWNRCDNPAISMGWN